MDNEWIDRWILNGYITLRYVINGKSMVLHGIPK